MTTDDTNPDFEKMLDCLHKMAERLLRQQESFLPFGVLISKSSEFQYIAVDVEEKDRQANTIQNTLFKKLREEIATNGFRAVGICIDTTGTVGKSSKKVDILRFYFENSDGSFDVIFVPYKRRLISAPKYDDAFRDQNAISEAFFPQRKF